MSINMRVHTVHEIEYGEPLLSAFHQYDFLDLLGKLGVNIYPEVKCSENQEIDRQSLEEARDVLVGKNAKKYVEYCAIALPYLERMEMPMNKFVGVINYLLSESDQRNSHINISWW